MSRRKVIVAVLLVTLVIGGAIVSAMQEDRIRQENETQGTAGPGPTETLVAIQDCPYGEASCILGQGIERALRRGLVEAVMEFGAPRFYICPGPGRSGAPQPLCDRVGADEGRQGYPVAQRFGESAVLAPEALQALLQAFVDAVQPEARDSVGDGALRLYAFSCTEAAFPAQNVSCAREGIILSAIVERGGERRRELLVFWAQGGFQGRTLPFTELWEGPVLEEELPILFRSGGELPDLGEVDVIDQSLPR